LKFFYWSKVFSSEGRVRGEGRSPKIHKKMLGSDQNYYHSTQNRKANNSLVRLDSRKCLCKKLQDFVIFYWSKVFSSESNVRGEDGSAKIH